MVVVKLSAGEKFLNWYAQNTKLYIRGQKGKAWEEQRSLDRELAAQVNLFFTKLLDDETADLQRKILMLEEENKRLKEQYEG